MQLKDKIIIITGASSGIGAAAALLFAQEGAKLVLGARREADLRTLTDQINQSAGAATYLAGDVQGEDYNKALVDLSVETYGGLDCAFNNAGTTGEMGPLPTLSAETWKNVIDVNLTSGFFAAKHQIPAMKASGGGALVFTSSFVGHTVGFPGMGAYAAAKAGLVGMTQVLAAEHGPEGIRANTLLPGGTKTAMAGDDPEFHEFVKGLHALKRMAEPKEIAQAAMFLLSDQASFVTGSAFIADGGNSINKI